MAQYASAYHSNGEVVIDNAVWHRVSFFLLVIRGNVNGPSVQHHLTTVLNVPEELEKIASFVAWRGDYNQVTWQAG